MKKRYSLFFLVALFFFSGNLYSQKRNFTVGGKVNGSVDVKFLYIANADARDPQYGNLEKIDLNAKPKNPKVKIVINKLMLNSLKGKKNIENDYFLLVSKPDRALPNGFKFETIKYGRRKSHSVKIAQKGAKIEFSFEAAGVLFDVDPSQVKAGQNTLKFYVALVQEKMTKNAIVWDRTFRQNFTVIPKKVSTNTKPAEVTGIPETPPIFTTPTNTDHSPAVDLNKIYNDFIGLSDKANTGNGDCGEVRNKGFDLKEKYKSKPDMHQEILFRMISCTWSKKSDFEKLVSEYVGQGYTKKATEIYRIRTNRAKMWAKKDNSGQTASTGNDRGTRRPKPEQKTFQVIIVSKEDIGDYVKYTLSFKNNSAIPSLERVEGTKDYLIGENKDPFVIQIPKTNPVELFFRVSKEEKGKIRINPMVIPLDGHIMLTDGRIKISGLEHGKAPYYLQVVDTAFNYVEFNLVLKENNTSVSLADIEVIREDDFQIRVVDATGTQYEKLTLPGTVHLKPRKSNAIFYTLIGLGIIGLMGFLGLKFFRRNNKQISAAYKEKLKSAEQVQSNGGSDKGIVVGVRSKNTTVNKNLISVSGMKSKSGLSTVLDHSGPATAINLVENLLADKEDYFPIDLSLCWENTAIEHIFLSKRAVAQISDFVFTQNKILHLQEEMIPEIGGFLIGKYALNTGTNRFQIVVEEFVDVEPKDSNVYQITFGARAWDWLHTRLDATESKGYKLVGWFHTHPGHGLFLSHQDINLHYTSFGEKFHFAMEIDSVAANGNESFSTGFFTSKQNEVAMNNKEDLKSGWFKWKEIEAWVRSV